MNPLEEIGMPILFRSGMVAEALDNYDVADPHRRADELDDRKTSPIVNAPLYDTSITTPLKKSNMSLQNFPDYSDEVLSDYNDPATILVMGYRWIHHISPIQPFQRNSKFSFSCHWKT